MENCLFCKIIEKQIPAKILSENESCLAFADLHPQAPQHILFIPKKHITSMAELTAEDGAMLGQLFEAAAQLAKELGLADPERGYRFLTNSGPDAGQSVHHLHFHLLGGRPFGWPPG